MKEKIPNGSISIINGKDSIYYDGYWIRRYEVIKNTLANKKKLIDQLTKRVFHHVEPGINTPGSRLEEIRAIFENEKNPSLKRVKGAMLAGALLNRGADILTSIVELEEAGVSIEPGNELLEQCGKCFVNALELGKNIKLSTGGEGLDEIWGEPFKVLHMSMEEFYESRYIKISQTMSQIDQLNELLIDITSTYKPFEDITDLINELCDSGKSACETLRSDTTSFEVWPRFVVAREHFEDYISSLINNFGGGNGHPPEIVRAIQLLKDGGQFVVNLSTVRVSMPNSMSKFLEVYNEYVQSREKQN